MLYGAIQLISGEDILATLRSMFSNEGFVGVLESTLILVLTLMIQAHIFLRRRKDFSIGDRRYETQIVGLNLLFIVLGLYVASLPRIEQVLGNSSDPTNGLRLAIFGCLFLLVGIGLIVRLVANPNRLIWPTETGHAYAVRDGINLVGFIALASYSTVIISIY